MASNLLPPNSTALERALAGLGDSFGAITIPVPDLQRPDACAANVLPFLAWGLGVDRWDATWSEDRQRQAVAGAIPDKRIRGSRASMDHLLADYQADYGIALTLDVPQPYFFTVTLPVNDAAAGNVTARFATSLLADISRTKGARDTFQLRQTALATASLPITVVARAMTMARQFGDLTGPDPADLLLLTTEYGEPLEGGEGATLEYI